MCTSIKVVLHDIEDGFNEGYLVLVLRKRILIIDYCWTKMLKNSGNHHSCMCVPDLLLSYSYWPEQGEAY